MKIVSKYKDFYDFFTHDYDADIVYVREPAIVYESYKKLYEDNTGKFYMDKERYVASLGYSNRYTTMSEGYVWFDSYVFGVFPNVYSQPIIGICLKTVGGYDERITITLTHRFVDDLCSLKTNEEQKAYVHHYVSKYINDYVLNHPCVKIPKKIILPSSSKTIGNYLKKFVWKYECREVFQKLNAPVWIERHYDLIKNSVYMEYPGGPKYKHIGNSTRDPQYIINICFNKLNDNILKYWYNDLMNLNTYINIENFLWSVKQEPIANPDNKTKILAHGFDLKTSFRKM